MKAWIWKRCSFDAAHTLPLHKGKCSNLHGHTYFVELGIECEVDPTTGMGIDMGDLGEFLEIYVGRRFDHENLNDKLVGLQPTAENIAKEVLETAIRYFGPLPPAQSPKAPQAFPYRRMKVKVFETPDSWVEVERVG